MICHLVRVWNSVKMPPAARNIPRVAVLVLLPCYAAIGDETPRSTMYPPKTELLPLPLANADRLSVNLGNLERQVVRGKPELAGIAEIAALLQHARYEEIWAFIPGDEHEQPTWYEIGRDVEETVDGMAIRVDRPFLRKLMREHSDIHLYHFHPLSYFERCAPASDCGYAAVPQRADQVSRRGFIANMRYAMPSPEDIYFMMDMSWEFKRIRGGAGTIRHRVVTPYGVVDYALTPEGQARFDADRNLRTGGLYIALVAGNALLDESIAGIVDRVSGEGDRVLTQLSKLLSSRYLRVARVYR